MVYLYRYPWPLAFANRSVVGDLHFLHLLRHSQLPPPLTTAAQSLEERSGLRPGPNGPKGQARMKQEQNHCETAEDQHHGAREEKGQNCRKVPGISGIEWCL